MSEQASYPKFHDAGVLWPNTDKDKGQHTDYGDVEIGGRWYKMREYQNNGHKKLQYRELLNHEVEKAIQRKNEYEAKKNSQAHQNLQNINQQIQGNPNLSSNRPVSQPMPNPNVDDEIPF